MGTEKTKYTAELVDLERKAVVYLDEQALLLQRLDEALKRTQNAYDNLLDQLLEFKHALRGE